MGDLTKNLSRGEFSCKCNYVECVRTPVDIDLAAAIQDCADHFAYEENKRNLMFMRVAVHVNSGYRCKKHNKDEGGSPTSTHTLGLAADHWMEYVYGDGTRTKVPDDAIADYYELRYPDVYGIVRYVGRTHFDVRQDGPVRSDNR